MERSRKTEISEVVKDIREGSKNLPLSLLTIWTGNF